MHWDREIGIPMAGGREDGERGAERLREIGELLLTVDELEDTLRVIERNPEAMHIADGETSRDVVRRIEQRIRCERQRLAALEQRGGIDYDEVERAIRLSDAMG